jgi:hypothetical protein
VSVSRLPRLDLVNRQALPSFDKWHDKIHKRLHQQHASSLRHRRQLFLQSDLWQQWDLSQQLHA